MYHQQPQYASTSNNNGNNNNYGMNQSQNHAGMGTIAPHETTKQPALVATGDWTKDLVHLAKTAELKCVFKLYPFRSQLAEPNAM